MKGQVKRVISIVVMLFASTLARADLIEYADQTIHIQYAPSLSNVQRKQTYVWLQRVADALLTVYGKWPKDRFNIAVKTSTNNSSPVPWGQVTRGTPDEVLLVINPDAGFKQITSDWTAFHELSHLLIPYQGYGDLWFSEGLATYYQNIIQARAGLLSELELWNKLASGFERGRKQNKLSHLDLEEISDNMRKYRNFMRVHWSGVHYWLSADIKLRQLSQNKMSLDSVLKQLKDCCYNKSMSAVEIAKKLDQLVAINQLELDQSELNQPELNKKSINQSSLKIFTPAFDKYKASHVMPDYDPVLSSLGVQFNQQGGVVLATDAPNSNLRKSIFIGNDF